MEEKEKQEVVFETSFLNQTLLLERTSLKSDSQVTVNIVSKHIWLSVSFRDSFYFLQGTMKAALRGQVRQRIFLL